MKARKKLRNMINFSIVSAWLIVFVMQIIGVGILYNQSAREAQVKLSDAVGAARSILERKLSIGTQLRDAVLSKAEAVEYFQSNKETRRTEILRMISQLTQDINTVTYEQFYVVFIDVNGEASGGSDDMNPQLLQSVRDAWINRGPGEEHLVFFTAPDTLFNEVYFCLPREIRLTMTEAVGTKFLGTAIAVGKINTTELLHQSAVGSSAYLLLRNGDKNVVIAPKAFEGKEYFLWSQRFAETGWRLGGGAPLDFPISAVLLLLILETALMPGIFLAVQCLINRNIYVPIHKIFSFLSHYSLNKKGDRIILQNQTEIGVIADQINEMIENTEKLSRRIVQTQQRLYESEIAQKDAALYALQAQLNPHFMYNTLDCICGLANASEAPHIADVTVALAKMLRYSTSDEKSVPLFQEIEILENYLTILNVRHQGQYAVTFDVSDDAEDAPCLKMLLQPIVENAVKHGFGEFTQNARLIISAKMDEDCLSVKIFDNGRGMSKEKLNELVHELDSLDNSFSIQTGGIPHIGLANIQNRIRLNYGNDYGLSIKSEEGKFTEIFLRLPGK